MGIETLAIASLAGSALSAGMGAIGAMQEGRATAQAATYQAAVARNNAIIQQQNAAQAVATGRSQAQEQDIRNRAVLGQIAAAQGASGIDIGSPTFQDVTAGQRQIGRLRTEDIMQTALERARGFNVEAMSETAQAQLEQMTAARARQAGTISAASSLLGGATSFADKWQRYQTTGVPGFGGGNTGPQPIDQLRFFP